MSLKEFSVESGQPLSAPHDDPAGGTTGAEFARIAIDLIVPSRTNPRRTFDEAKLQELATNIAGIGVLQPILVRALPADRLEETSVKGARKDKRPTYEIVSGERRWRASRIANQASIPAIVRHMTDDQVLEAQLVENLQRDDLHPLEEAEGYRRLCEATGITKDDVAGKIGKSRTYVYNRLKLLTLTAESAQAFRDGKLDASRAELLATVADPKLQLKALKEFTTEGYGGSPKSVRDCRDWLANNILLKLKDAPFNTKDDALVEGCGACTSCPKRTHADRDLFAAFDGPDMCTDAPCYRAKEDAHLGRLRAEAEAKGMDLIAGKEAKKLKPWAHSEQIANHTRLTAKFETLDGEVTVASLMKGRDVKTVLFVDPHDPTKTVKIVPTAAVEQALKDKGLLTESRSEQSQKLKAAAARDKAKREMEARWHVLTVEAIVERLRDGAVHAFSARMLRILLHTLLGQEGADNGISMHLLLRLWHLPPVEGDGYSASEERFAAVHRHVDAVHDEALGPMVLHVLAAADLEPGRYSALTHQPIQGTPAIDAIAEEAGVDPHAILADLKAEAKAAAKVKSAPPPGTTPEAAPQPPVVAKDKPKGARRPKTSIEDAQHGIADAMQNMGEPGAGDGEAPPAWLTFTVGMQLRVKDTAPKSKAKWIGKEGELREIEIDGIYRVAFPDQVKPVGFDGSDLEAVQ